MRIDNDRKISTNQLCGNRGYGNYGDGNNDGYSNFGYQPAANCDSQTSPI